jgi:hypothetical protein
MDYRGSKSISDRGITQHRRGDARIKGQDIGKSRQIKNNFNYQKSG